MTPVLIVGGLLTGCLLLNAGLSFVGPFARWTSWFRLKVALLAAVATMVLANGVRMVGL